MIKLALVEDDSDLREGFVDLLSDSDIIDVVGLYSNAEDFILEYDRIDVDVVVMDIQLPGLSGIECIAFLKNKKTNVQFLVYTIFDDDEKVFSSLCAGANGYLIKSSNSEKLINAILSVYNGGSPISENIARKIILYFQNTNSTPKKLEENIKLTSQETEILKHLSEGYKFSEIADIFCININDIKKLIREIYDKLQVNSRVKALEMFKKIDGNYIEKYKNTYITEGQIDQMINSLNQLFQEEKLYLDSDLTISKVANSLGVQSYAISRAINSKLGKNFFDYVNNWRINEACEILKSSYNETHTLEALAYDCGFGSKVSFNNSFKKLKNCTPKEWKSLNNK